MRLGAKRSSRYFRNGNWPAFQLTARGLTIRSQSGQEIAEFGSVLLIILLLVFFPFIDMVMFFASYGVIYITCNLSARAAAPTFTHTAAVAAVTSLFTNPFITGLQHAAKVTSNGSGDAFSPGYKLTVLEGSSTSPTLSTVAAGSIVLPVPSGTYYLYEETADLTLSPLFPLPLIGSGQPVKFHATCFIEHPEGLNQ